MVNYHINIYCFQSYQLIIIYHLNIYFTFRILKVMDIEIAK